MSEAESGPSGERDQNEQDNEVVEIAKSSETGMEGPDQILETKQDSTWEANGRVRIKLGDQDRAHEPLSVPGMLMRTAKKWPNHPALVSRPGVDGKRNISTFKQFERKVRIVAKAFLKLGLERHRSVCILGYNCPQWVISDLAAIYAGGIAAGIYPTNSPEACQHCAENSEANIIVVEDDEQLQKILKIRENLPKLKKIIQYEGIPISKDVLSWNELLDIGKKESDDELDGVLKSMGLNECCTLVYTSGTVGDPKAVMLSHDNLLTENRAVVARLDLKEAQEVLISFLPLSHVAAQVLDVYFCVVNASTIYFADKSALKGNLLSTLTVAQPTLFVGVPRVWEKIYEKMQDLERVSNPLKNWLVTWAKTQGLKYNLDRAVGIDYRSWSYLTAKFLVFRKIKALLGLGRCRSLVSGGAPLSIEVKHYFMSLDMVVLDVYGMSENVGGHTLGSNENFRLGSVGQTMREFRTKLKDVDETGEGEICMQGRHVFMGYLKDPEKTREAKDEDGWLHSGDLGRMDDDGFLYVTGRIKELIITAGGENIPLLNIESLVMRECSALSNVMLIGDKRKFLTMFVTLKTEMNPSSGAPLDALSPETIEWVKSMGSNSTTLSEILRKRDPIVYEEIEASIGRANAKSVSRAQKIQKFRILPRDFSMTGGELGPTLKLRRNFVLQKYNDFVEEMYAE